MNDTIVTNNDDLFEKRILQDDDPVSPDFYLISFPCTSEKYNNTEKENIQLQTVREIYPSEIKRPMIISFFYPSISNGISKIIEFLLPLDTPTNSETNLKCQKRDPSPILFWNFCINEDHKKLRFYCKNFCLDGYSFFIGILPNISKSL